MKWDRLRARAALAFARLSLPRPLRPLLRRKDPYAVWQEVNRLTPAARADLTDALLARRGKLPLISVIMPVYRPDFGYLRAAIASIRDQLHPDWQLCICDDGSKDPQLTAELAQFAADDPRIKVSSLLTNGGISAATNMAASAADGAVLLFMDQDDLLAPDCIAEFAIAFADKPAVELIYSDSDKLGAGGIRRAPTFKPGWSPVLLLSYMYLSHAVAMRRSLFERLGGMRSEFDGSQDFDLALRASEVVEAAWHIPRILYHWRILAGSTALSASEKPASLLAGERAVIEAVARRKIAARVERPEWAVKANLGLFDLRFTDYSSKLSVILVLPEGFGDHRRALIALLKTVPPSAQIIILQSDRVASGLSGEECASFKLTVVKTSREAPLADRLAKAAAIATGDVVVFVSAGLRPIGDDWLKQLSGYIGVSGVGLVGARLINSDGRLRGAGMIHSSPEGTDEQAFAGAARTRAGVMYLARTSRECAAVSAHCIAISRDLLARIGGIPPGLRDPDDIGAELSRAVLARGASVMVCATCELQFDVNHASPPGWMRPGLTEDIWYNRNLGRGAYQFLPSRRCFPLRRTGALKLAVVTHNLDREGAQSTLFDLVNGLKDAGQVVPFVISPRDGELAKAYRECDIPVEIVPTPGRRAAGLSLAGYRQALVHAYERGGADVVLANTLESHAAIAAAAEAGLGSIWWQHEGGAWHRYFRHLPRRARARAFAAFGQAYRVVQVAEATRLGWLPLATRSNFELIRNAIPPGRLAADTSRWKRADARESIGIAAGDCCVLLLGSVSQRKGQEDVLQALKMFPSDDSSNLKIVVAGAFVEDKYRKKLDDLYNSLSPELRSKVILSGAVEDAAKYYAAADIFLCCSRQESAPRTIVEAMAFGLPVITTPVDGIPELVQAGDLARFYVPGDHRHLVELLVQFATSPDTRIRLGQEGQKHVSRANDFDVMIARFGALMREAARAG